MLFITSVNAKFICLFLQGKQDEELYQHNLNKVLQNYFCVIKQNKECLRELLTKHIEEGAGYREVKVKPRNKQIERESWLDGEWGKDKATVTCSIKFIPPN